MIGKRIQQTVLLTLFLIPRLLLAESVEVSLEPRIGVADEPFSLTVSVTGADMGAVSGPNFESSKDFQFESAGTATRFTVTNGTQHLQLVFEFRVIPRADLPPGQYQLPRGYFIRDSRQVFLDPLIVTIRPTAPAPKTEPQAKLKGMDLVQVVDNTDPYKGQQVLYRTEAASPYEISEAKFDDEDFTGFIRESFGKTREQLRTIVNGNVQVYSVREALFPNQAGTLTIPERQIDLTVQVPLTRKLHREWSLLDDIFPELMERRESIRKILSAKAISLKVRPLPPAPEGISGFIPVGEVKFDYGIDKINLKEGDSLNLWLEFDGDANLRPFEINLPNVTADGNFKIYADKPVLETRIIGDRIYFRKRFQFGIVPQRFGSLPFPKVRFATFDPSKGQYNVRELPLKSIPVDADPTRNTLPYNPSAVQTPAPKIAPVEKPKERPIPRSESELLPNHPPEVLAESALSSPPRLIWWAVLLALPLTALIFWLSRIREERFKLDPLLGREQNALKSAERDLKSVDSLTSADLSRVVRSYLSDRLRVQAEGLTSRDVERVIGPKLRSDKLLGSLKELLQKLERQSYSARTTVTQETVNEISAVMKEIERTV